MDGKLITVGLAPESVGGITARSVEFGDSLVNPLLWGEPQTANESRAAITRYSSLSETSIRIRRTIDSSEPKVSGSAVEDFGWMVISDGTATGINRPTPDPSHEGGEALPFGKRGESLFTLDGRRVAAPSSGGLYIRRITYPDGSIRTQKVFF